MRLFFALQPEQHTCLEIAAFREHALPPLDHPVPVSNLHVTLAFLGDVKENQMESLYELAANIRMAPFQLVLDELGYWPKPKILWIGASQTPPELSGLVDDLKSLARTLRLPVDKRDYLAHVTIARNCLTPPPTSISAPGIVADFAGFTLFQSTLRKGHVHYDALADWRFDP